AEAASPHCGRGYFTPKGRFLKCNASATPSSRQDDAEAVAELDQVGAVDRPVAVEVQERDVARVRGDGPEGAAERRQVQAIDRLVAVHVAEKTEQAENVFPARQP